MASNHISSNGDGGGRGKGSDDGSPPRSPEWADGLKQLYDSVVEEALPDTFEDLLDRLDELAPQEGSNDNAEPPSPLPPAGRGKGE